MKMSPMSVFCGDDLGFQHYFLLILLRRAAPDLEMSSKCLKAHVQAEHISDSRPIYFFPPFLGKLKHMSFWKTTN